MALSIEAADLHNSSYHIIQPHPIILLINSGRTELLQNVPSGCEVMLQKARTIFPDNNIQYDDDDDDDDDDVDDDDDDCDGTDGNFGCGGFDDDDDDDDDGDDDV